MSGFHDNVLLGASGSQGYQISRSVRLRSSASAYFDRTFTTPTSRRIFTLSAWTKRGVLGATAAILGNAGTREVIGFFGSTSGNGDALHFRDTTNGAYEVTTTAVFRDPSAWYHIVVAFDTTQATASNRVKMYVNGVQQTSFAVATYPAQNTDLNLNSAVVHAIGRRGDGASYYLDGYLTEINFIDGQALTPSSFGETNTVTGVWQPKKYAGTYGTNGFYLNFSDNSAATAAAIGKDYSGNGNNWTPNNISVTAGSTYDSMLDVPTQWADGGNGRGNYAVLNPLALGTSQTALREGNLYAAPISGASNWGTAFSTIAIPTSGKWYVEATAIVAAGAGNNSSLGVVDSTSFVPSSTAILYTFSTGEGFDGILCHLFSDYVSPISDGVQGTNVTGITGTSVNLMLALDVDNGKVYAGYNGTWLNSGNPAGNTGEVAARVFSQNDVVCGHTSWNGTNDQGQYFNFGQRPFAYTPPSGFKALNTLNLPTPTILKGNQYFNAVLYSGNSGSQSITGVGFQPDFVWGKSRNIAENNGLFDAVRGVNKALYSNLTNAEATDPGVSAFNSDGFSLNGSTINATGYTYVAWNWKEGATQGFDIVTYTGTGANRTVAHNLGVAPSMIITKGRDSVAGATNWKVYHASLGNTKNLNLNLTNAEAVSSTVWNNTSPTSSVFSLGTSGDVNANTATYVAYLFAEVAGFSKFGSYTGNGSADGPFVFCGFRPRYVMVKRTDTAGYGWIALDTARNTYNVVDLNLNPNDSVAEFTTTTLDILSNGFKLRTTDLGRNASGGTYIYAAFAENPFKNALAR